MFRRRPKKKQQHKPIKTAEKIMPKVQDILDDLTDLTDRLTEINNDLPGRPVSKPDILELMKIVGAIKDKASQLPAEPAKPQPK
jgi:hypothetical protein